MKMGMVNRNTFFTIQDTYYVDAIKEYWEERRKEAISHLQGKNVMVGLYLRQTHVNKGYASVFILFLFCFGLFFEADGRDDSPGHTAQYCSYSTMEKKTK